MIRNFYILTLLLSLSYGQPDTEWTQVNIPSNQNIVKLISDGNGLYGATSTASIYFSSDNGLNWESLPLHPDIFAYGVDLFDKVDDYLFFNQNIGGSTYTYRTYYNGANWEDWEILPYDESIIYEFVHYDNTIYALLNQGLSVSSDYGTSWELIDTPSITGYIHLQYVNDQYLYINHGCILYRYNIETFEWVDITGILDDIGPPEPYSCTSIHQIEKFNDKLLISMYWYGGVGTLFYSQNNGDSWEIINSFPSLSSSGYGTNNVPAVATKNGILYAGTATSEDGIYYTHNLIDWTEYSAGLSNYNLSVSELAATEEYIYKLGGSVNLFQNELIGVSGDIYGCTDPEACNYDEEANIDDGSCSGPYLCDDGENLECNLENCPDDCDLGDVNCDGELNVLDVVLMVNMILEDEYDEIADVNEDGSLNVLDVVILVNLILDNIPNDTVTDIDGNVYETVQIGEQLWMAENLKVTHYQNSDEIPYIYNDPQYGAYINYSNNADNVAVYGRLYNWFAVNDERDLCPDNWHVPSDDEFKSLEMYLGMSESEANGEGLRGTDEGGQLKEEGNEHWNSPNTGATNETGFTALPGGNRRYETYTNQEIFCCLNRYGFFWSSSEVYTVNAWYRVLSYDYSESNRYHLSKTNAFSVRCVED